MGKRIKDEYGDFARVEPGSGRVYLAIEPGRDTMGVQDLSLTPKASRKLRKALKRAEQEVSGEA
jgi:hypothetical protein